MLHRHLTLWPGLATAVLVAIAAHSLAGQYSAPVMLLALLVGMAVNFLSQEPRCKPGLDFAAKQVLRWGVALLGLKISAGQIQTLNAGHIVVVVLAVTATIAFGTLMARAFGFQPFFGFLSGGAVGICGASAAMAIAAAFPHHPQKERATLFVVISVSALSTLAMVIYPLFVRWWELDPQLAGIFLGATIHDVAQVVGAGYSMGPETGDVATLVKLIRVAMLVPVIAVAVLLTRVLPLKQSHESETSDSINPGPSRPPLLPGFAVAFAVLVVLNALQWVPGTWIDPANTLSRWFLLIAMAAIGVKTHLKDLWNVGWRPVVLMLLETLFLATFVFVALRLVQS
jgi:uncharacterized integral membrane protein (TIGR00698 family)